jgi:hypothetical protein
MTFHSSYVTSIICVVHSLKSACHGYVASFFAARLRVSRRISAGLLLCVAAMTYEMVSNRNAPFAVGLHALPACVAFIHVVAHASGRVLRRVNPD